MIASSASSSISLKAPAAQPRPTKGILDAITVRNSTLASSGRLIFRFRRRFVARTASRPFVFRRLFVARAPTAQSLLVGRRFVALPPGRAFARWAGSVWDGVLSAWADGYARIDQVFEIGLAKFLGGVRRDIATLSDEIGRQFLLD